MSGSEIQVAAFYHSAADQLEALANDIPAGDSGHFKLVRFLRNSAHEIRNGAFDVALRLSENRTRH